MSESTVRYEQQGGVAVVTLARPEKRNAQNLTLLYELNAAFDRAAADTSVKVLLLQADGPDFSSGHDLRDVCDLADFQQVGTWRDHSLPGAEGYFSREQEIYLGLCWRWRNFPKPSIAAVQGRTIAGGLMLVWVCDIIVASSDATFTDPVVAMGVNGVEFFSHPWELGARKAKEILFTGDAVDAETARQLGMVNQVVPAETLREYALDMGNRIAQRPSFALKLAKQSVNQTLDAQGFWTSQQAAMSLHHLGHSHNQEMFGQRVDPSGFPAAVKR